MGVITGPSGQQIPITKQALEDPLGNPEVHDIMSFIADLNVVEQKKKPSRKYSEEERVARGLSRELAK
jgi:hypothetical protein